MKNLLGLLVLNFIASVCFAQNDLMNQYDKDSLRTGEWTIKFKYGEQHGYFEKGIEVGKWEIRNKKRVLTYEVYYSLNANDKRSEPDSIIEYFKAKRYSGESWQSESRAPYDNYWKCAGKTKNGLREGLWWKYRYNYGYREYVNYKNGLRDGKTICFSAYGDTCYIINYKNGLKEGEASMNQFLNNPDCMDAFSDFSQRFGVKGNYINNKREGEWIVSNYHEQELFTYERDTLNGKYFSNNTYYNVLMETGNYKNGLEEGEWVFRWHFFDDIDSSMRISHYSNNVTNGIQQFIFKNKNAITTNIQNGIINEISVGEPNYNRLSIDSVEANKYLLTLTRFQFGYFADYFFSISRTDRIRMFRDDDEYSGAIEIENGKVKDGIYPLYGYWSKRVKTLIVDNGVPCEFSYSQ